jgi:hypothetical protein
MFGRLCAPTLVIPGRGRAFAHVNPESQHGSLNRAEHIGIPGSRSAAASPATHAPE